MKGQKQSKADLQEKKIQALINVVQRILDENAYLRDYPLERLRLSSLCLVMTALFFN